MDIRAYVRNFLAVAEKLKCNTRHSWTSTGRRASVAEHSWRLALMAYLVRDEFAGSLIWTGWGNHRCACFMIWERQ